MADNKDVIRRFTEEFLNEGRFKLCVCSMSALTFSKGHVIPAQLVPPFGPPFFGEKQGLWGDE